MRRSQAWVLQREDGTPLPYEEHPSTICLREQRVAMADVLRVVRADGRLRWITATASNVKGSTELSAPSSTKAFHDVRSAGRCCPVRMAYRSRTPLAISMRAFTRTIGPSTGAAMRINKKDTPQMAASSTTAPSSLKFITVLSFTREG
jgi:hypothetical protein